ncbi:MAG: DUF2723 domain-containing protein [Planctomycetota bacterium]|nr:DUF2723 domain-containing protein [Planctomycetota bacterium]
MRTALIVFAALIVVFLLRAAPGVTFEDAGELVAAAGSWGVPHPPGYPLLTLVGGVFIEVGAWFGLAPARAMVLVSVLSAAGAAALLARFVELVRPATEGRRWLVAPLACGVLLALSPTFRAQAIVVEAYALAALCNAALLLASLRARPAVVGLLFGLTIAAHPSGLFSFPLFAFAVLRAGGGRELGRGLVGLALGLSTYLYVPLAAATKPAVNWGGIDGLGSLMDHLLRRQFGATPERDLVEQATFLAEHLIGQWPALILLGLVFGGVLTRRAPKLPPGTEASLVGPALGLVGVTLLVQTLGLFWAQHYPVTEEITRVRLAGSFVPLVLFGAAGLGLLCLRIEARLSGRFGGRYRLPLLLLVVVGANLHASPYGEPTLAKFQDMSAMTEAESYAREVLEPPAGASQPTVILINRLGYSDVLYFPLLYAQTQLDLGAGCLVIDRELLGAAWYRAELIEALPSFEAGFRELGAAIDAAGSDPRMRRIAQVPHLRRLAQSLPDGLALIGRPGPRLVEGEGLAGQPGPGPVSSQSKVPGAGSGQLEASAMGSGRVGGSGSRLHLSADERFWWLTTQPRASSPSPPSRPYLDRKAALDPWRAELLREALERDNFRAKASTP